MRVVIWMNMPSHHQAPFFQGLRGAGVDLSVRYYGRVSADRLALGWNGEPDLPAGERYVRREAPLEEQVPDWLDAVHVVPGCGSAFLRSLAARLSAAGAAWVHWSENSNPGIRRILSYLPKRWYGSLVNRSALGAFGVSARALGEFRSWGIREEKTALLPYSIAATDVSAEPDEACERFRQGRPAFLFLGSLRRLKGIDVLIRAFSVVARNDDRWVLLLVGDDRSEKNCRRLTKGLGVEDRVFFRGPVPSSRTAGVLRLADVLLLPSRCDGWGAVAGEAASAGKALVLSDRVGAAYHLLEPGENGFRVRAGSVDSLAGAMAAYVEDETLARRHGETSLALFQRFTPAKNTQRFLNAIKGWRSMRRAAAGLREAA
jgi:glycosyltransferase involved in cell wall biosynthesis